MWELIISAHMFLPDFWRLFKPMKWPGSLKSSGTPFNAKAPAFCCLTGGRGGQWPLYHICFLSTSVYLSHNPGLSWLSRWSTLMSDLGLTGTEWPHGLAWNPQMHGDGAVCRTKPRTWGNVWQWGLGSKVGLPGTLRGVEPVLGGPEQPYSAVWTGLRSQEYFPQDSPVFIPLLSKPLGSDHHALDGKKGSINSPSFSFQRAAQTMHSIFFGQVH